MTDPMHNPSFVAYAATTLLLCLNLLGLWGWSGGVRTFSKTVVNPEDARTVNKGAAIVESDPAAVARVMRAWQNAQANIVPFLLIAWVWVLAGAAPLPAHVLFGSFVVLRYVHSFVYLRELQPWRTLSFALGGLVTGLMAADTIRLLVTAIT